MKFAYPLLSPPKPSGREGMVLPSPPYRNNRAGQTLRTGRQRRLKNTQSRATFSRIILLSSNSGKFYGVVSSGYEGINQLKIGLCYGARAQKIPRLRTPHPQMFPPVRAQKATSNPVAHQTKATAKIMKGSCVSRLFHRAEYRPNRTGHQLL